MRALVAAFAASFFVACAPATPAIDPSAVQSELIAWDARFSDDSAKRGLVAAFDKVLAPDAVVLRAGTSVRGKAAVLAEEAEGSEGVTLTWKPEAATVSASGDLGYTWGSFLWQSKDTKLTGVYLSIWRRDPVTKTWQLVLDTGSVKK